MGYIKFNNSQDNTHNALVRRESDTIVKISFLDAVIENTSGFLYSDREDFTRILGRYLDYTTIYRIDGKNIWLSNDGSVYVEKTQEEIKPYVPTLDELKGMKKQEISWECEKTIYSGIDVELQNGTEHFSLSEKDQINLFGKQAQLAAGAETLEYHQDGHPCRYYSGSEMQKIIETAMFHVSYHTTYCNSINMWIAGAETKEEIESIFYGAVIPKEYISVVLADYLKRMN